MPETINDKKIFSLLEVTQSIQKTLADRYKSVFWVKAEMNKLNHYSYSGHCYPELLEKKDGKVVAQLRSVLWKNDFLRINNDFLRILKEPLKDGIRILFCATISFDPVHGLSLRIIDIDPSWSLGELEREKQQTIEQLQQEGIFTCNKQLVPALLPQRIAIISVETSKGYADFLKVLNGNHWGYRFFQHLFPALLQGDQSVDSIIKQLQKIKAVASHFDVVAIIRGGGGDVGLSSYNNYRLAKEIALFPLPVITGIGHATNETVAEMVAFKNAITPTELADYLIQSFHDFAVPVQQAEEKITTLANRLLRQEKSALDNEVKFFRSVARGLLQKNQQYLNNRARWMINQAIYLIKHHKTAQQQLQRSIDRNALQSLKNTHRLLKDAVTAIEQKSGMLLHAQQVEINGLEKTVNLLNPVHVLKRGYSITLQNGRVVKSVTEIKQGDAITTITHDGSIASTVSSTQKNTLP
ncbi:exodeoxyribonuclease VII large subunit [Foetidibacter luteolus]|uniref:exodeoxyribonuclease VII large subunit n=1 Tax=Foetidibacter luteolus TaxID=2608880 RepID=UPI00129A885A|nr:exodeoxyribonuclease VII large subunit [Foetidibacter luteolus]